MKLKKILFGIVVLSMFFCLVSCGGTTKQPDKPDDSSQEIFYTVTFNSLNGSNVTSQSIKTGGKVTKPTDPTKSGYEFKGWYKDEACTKPWNFNTDTVTSTITLYAKWEEMDAPAVTYSISFNMHGHGVAPTKVEKATALPTPLPTVADVDGWHFIGWYLESNYVTLAKAGKALTDNVTLHARWEEVVTSTYSISFNMHEHGVAPAKVEKTSKLPTPLPIVTDVDDWVFSGWYLDATYTSVATPGARITADTTLHAKWLKKISGVEFEDKEVIFNGEAQSVLVTGTLPTGVTATYIGNNKTEVGQYKVSVLLSGNGYASLNLDAALTIKKAQFEGITFNDEKFEYDATSHTIEIVGLLPEGTTVTYSCAENAAITNSAVETGTYTITATLTNKNFETKVLTAKLQITASEDERHITYQNGTLYFANALDNDRLYSYDNETLKRLSFDVPYYFTSLGNNLYFQSHSLFASSIKEIGDGTVSTVAPLKGDYLCTDGTYLYYALNGLTNNKSGIYKVNPKAAEPEAVLLSSGKAKYLQYYNGYLYFADGMNDDKLARISTTASFPSRINVVDEKITCLTLNNGVLYFTVNKLLGDYIASYTISTGKLVKLTSDAGADLTVVGNELYYLNVDLLNSAIYGKGIYKVSATRTSDSSAVGTKVIGEANENYSSLTLAGNRLAYYKVSTQMLCLYNITSESVTEVLDGFVAPEVTPLSTGSKTLAYKNTLYYLDLYNDKALYAVNTVTNTRSRITSNKVSDFTIIGDTLYFNQVSYGVNNDLYKIDLKNGGTAELVSKNDCVDVVSDGTNIYYVEQNAVGARTAIHKIDASGVDTILYTKGADYLTYYKGYLYFVDGKDLLKISVTDATNTVVTVKKGNTDTFVIYNDTIYFREMHGLAWAFKNLSKMNLDGSNETVVCGTDTDPIHLVVEGNKLYYCSDITKDSGSGIYCLDLTKASATPELILARKSGNTSYYASDFTVLNGYIYFVNYYNNLGDSHLYKVNISTKTLSKAD